MALIERSGNLHVHTTYSDGSGDYDAVAAAARQAGLDFLVVTDHNVYPAQEAGWRQGVLTLVGEEVHDPAAPHQNHFLAVDAGRDVAPLAGDTAALVAAVAADRGLGFIAHPFEHSGAYAGEAEIDWLAWETQGYTGIELWNYMSEFKSYATSPLTALWYAYFPRLAIRGPYPETLQRWDELLAAHPRRPGEPAGTGGCVAIGGADAHASTYRLGPLRKQVFPYRHLFAAVNTHLLLAEDWRHDLAADAALVYQALAQGRAFVAYDALAPARGFRFTATQGDTTYTLGDVLPAGPTRFTVQAPARAHLRLLRDGVCIATAEGRELAWQEERPGAYRVEALRTYGGRRRGWIYANPIWLA